MRHFASCWKISIIWWVVFITMGLLWQFWPTVSEQVILFWQVFSWPA